MSVIVIILLSISLIFTLAMKGKLEKRVCKLFNIYWILLMVFSVLMPYGGHKISDRAYLIFAVFAATISIGYVVGVMPKHKVYYTKQQAQDTDENIKKAFTCFVNSKFLLCFLLIVLLINIIYAYKYYSVISVVGGVEARNLRFFVGELFRSTYELLFFNYIITPVKYLACFIIAMEIYFEIFKRLPTCLCFCIAALSSYIGGGRFELMYLLLCIILAFFMKSQVFTVGKHRTFEIRKSTLKSAFLIIVACCGILFMSVYATALRRNRSALESGEFKNNSQILLEQFSGYNLGGLGAFDVGLDSGLIKNQYYFGRASIFGGFEEIMQYITKYVGFSFTSVRTKIGIAFNDSIHVGNKDFNALYTALSYFYQDFGILGVAILSYAFGFFVGRTLKNRRRSLFLMGVFFHAFYQYMILNLNWYFTSGDSLIYFLMLWLMTKKFRVNNEDESIKSNT